MTKYATIDMSSGYVWWTGEAADAISACKASDLAGGNEAREFAEITRSESGNADYAVYAIPAHVVITDGNNPDQIAAVESGQFVSFCAAL